MPRISKKRSSTSVSTPIEKKKSRAEHKNSTSIDDQEIKLTNNNTEPGVVLTCGSGDVGQLGLGEDVMEKLRPAIVPTQDKIVDICCGGMHTLTLDINGQVYSWGCNDEGALGRTGDDCVPGKVELPAPAVMLSAGDSHSAALLEDGRVMLWGCFRDASGSMGLLTDKVEKVPIHILPNYSFTRIASGADHLVLLSNKNDILTMGCGQQGQLGRLSSRSTNRDSRFGIQSSLEPALVNTKEKIRQQIDNIWAGTYDTFISVSEDIYAFGLNNYHQLGLPSEEPYFRMARSVTFNGKKWKKITSGLHHTLALDENGLVYALGRKEYGRLGLGEDSNDAHELIVIPKLQNKKCVDIACGGSTSFAVTEEGELYSWGMGTSGALGTGAEDDIFEPKLIQSKQLLERSVLRVASGGQHTAILASALKNNNDKNGV